ncbi:MAG: DUF4255 domain-containing protein [Chloroflexi bacterium]|nr:DUF4255 domain-containing protein [Chloroflexota bacterium]
MIKDLDETLKRLVTEKVPLKPAIGISFETPNREWAASPPKPTMVNMYLYDIRENHQLRGYEVSWEQKGDKATRKKAPPRIDLSYLITVWTKDIGDEHTLLGNFLVTLMRYPVLPVEMFSGALKGLPYPVHASVAQPDGLLKNPADFWTALGNQLKPSINYVVTLPMDLGEKPVEVDTVATRVIGVEELVQVAGRVYEKGRRDGGVAHALVSIRETGSSVKTDIDGKYTFAGLPKGKSKLTFRVAAPGRRATETKIEVPGGNYDIELERG